MLHQWWQHSNRCPLSQHNFIDAFRIVSAAQFCLYDKSRAAFCSTQSVRFCHPERTRGWFCGLALPVAPLEVRSWRVMARNKKPPGQVTERLSWSKSACYFFRRLIASNPTALKPTRVTVPGSGMSLMRL